MRSRHRSELAPIIVTPGTVPEVRRSHSLRNQAVVQVCAVCSPDLQSLRTNDWSLLLVSRAKPELPRLRSLGVLGSLRPCRAPDLR